jgi:hypothetical protein
MFMEMTDPILPKEDRLALFFSFMQQMQPAGTATEELGIIALALNTIEDKHSGVPYNPDAAGSDGRMYPPDERFRYRNWERPGVRCYRQVAHATFVADNGAVEIRRRKGAELGEICFAKPGKDGRKVHDYEE